MNREDFIENEFEIKDYYQYLKKETVQLPQKAKIIDVIPTLRKNRPLFVAEFPHGKYKFDFCVDVLKDFVEEYGNKPKLWIGIKLKIKANPYLDSKKRGLRLVFIPI